MTKIPQSTYVSAARALLTRVQSGQSIPYVSGGMSLFGMDCQGLCEYLLIQCGISAKECNLKGSNAHWRNCLWTGTPEECTSQFGRIPEGAWVFIVEHDGGEKSRGYNDDMGNASHMGVYLGDCAIHASASRGCVAQSTFVGKTIPNGGWNAIGLPPWIDYGITSETGGVNDGATESLEDDDGTGSTVVMTDIPAKAEPRTATVVSPDGNPVKIRPKANKKSTPYWKVAVGTQVSVERSKNGWGLITALCTDGYTRRAYMMEDFLRYEG